MAKKTTPEQIFEAALKVFARYGLRRARMEDIAAELDMATGTLYRYVKDKLDLYEKAVAHAIRRWQHKVFDAVEQTEDVIEQFLIMGRKGYGYLAADKDLRKLLINDPTIFPLSPRKQRFPDIDTASIALIKAILQKGVEQKIFRPINVEHVAELLYSVYVMLIIKTYVKSDPDLTQQMFDEGLELILTGLLANPIRKEET